MKRFSHLLVVYISVGPSLQRMLNHYNFQAFFCATNQCSSLIYVLKRKLDKLLFKTYTNVARHPLKGNPQFIATSSCLCVFCAFIVLD